MGSLYAALFGVQCPENNAPASVIDAESQKARRRPRKQPLFAAQPSLDEPCSPYADTHAEPVIPRKPSTASLHSDGQDPKPSSETMESIKQTDCSASGIAPAHSADLFQSLLDLLKDCAVDSMAVLESVVVPRAVGIISEENDFLAATSVDWLTLSELQNRFLTLLQRNLPSVLGEAPARVSGTRQGFLKMQELRELQSSLREKKQILEGEISAKIEAEEFEAVVEMEAQLQTIDSELSNMDITLLKCCLDECAGLANMTDAEAEDFAVSEKLAVELIVLIGFCLPELVTTSRSDLSVEIKTKQLEQRMDNLLAELDRFQSGADSCRDFLKTHEEVAGASLEDSRRTYETLTDKQSELLANFSQNKVEIAELERLLAAKKQQQEVLRDELDKVTSDRDIAENAYAEKKQDYINRKEKGESMLMQWEEKSNAACRELEVLRGASEELASGLEKMKDLLAEADQLKNLVAEKCMPELKICGDKLLKARSEILGGANDELREHLKELIEKAGAYDPELTQLMDEADDESVLTMLSEVKEDFSGLDSSLEEACDILRVELPRRSEAARRVLSSLSRTIRSLSQLRTETENEAANLSAEISSINNVHLVTIISEKKQAIAAKNFKLAAAKSKVQKDCEEKSALLLVTLEASQKRLQILVKAEERLKMMLQDIEGFVRKALRSLETAQKNLLEAVEDWVDAVSTLFTAIKDHQSDARLLGDLLAMLPLSKLLVACAENRDALPH